MNRNRDENAAGNGQSPGARGVLSKDSVTLQVAYGPTVVNLSHARNFCPFDGLRRRQA